jgi:Protein of unknown function (DUF2917)
VERTFTGKLETELRLSGRGVYDMVDYRPGTVIFCKKGIVWVTQSNDVEDHVLYPGDEFVSDRRGKVIVQAMRDSAVRIRSRQPGQASRRSSLSQGRPA